jgi:isopenicillin N synthase-like dioxygenase
MAIPSLDLSHFLDGSVDAKSAFAKQLVECFSEYGAVKLTGYSVSPSVISELFDWVHETGLTNAPR